MLHCTIQLLNTVEKDVSADGRANAETRLIQGDLPCNNLILTTLKKY